MFYKHKKAERKKLRDTKKGTNYNYKTRKTETNCKQKKIIQITNSSVLKIVLIKLIIIIIKIYITKSLSQC